MDFRRSNDVLCRDFWHSLHKFLNCQVDWAEAALTASRAGGSKIELNLVQVKNRRAAGAAQNLRVIP